MKPGRQRYQLAGLIEHTVPNIRVDALDLHPARGYWRSGRTSEAFRWEGWGWLRDHPTVRVSVYSYDTMTNCVRYGIEFTSESPTDYEFHAKGPKAYTDQSGV